MAHIKVILKFVLIARVLGRVFCHSKGTEEDEVYTRIVQEYKHHCPDTVTCDTSNASRRSMFPRGQSMFSRGQSMFTLRFEVSCCRACSCEAGCGSYCCPDMPDIHTEILEESPSRKCMYAQYRPYDVATVNGRAIFMINQCPSDFSGNFNITVGCKADTFDVTKQNSIDMLPVTSTVSGTTYKNWMCAVCHGETKSVLVYWEARFLCVGVSKLPETIDDIIYYASNVHCNILFFPSVSGLSVERCVKTIDSCNVTGKWDVYDPLVDAACSSYESIYDSDYKNIHCFLCNHKHGVDVKEKCFGSITPEIGGNTFMATLNFNMFEQLDEESKETCTSDHFYDTVKGSCRRIACSRGLVYMHGQCEPLFNIMSGRFVTPVYILTLALAPNKVNGTDTLNVHLIEEMLSEATHRATEMDLAGCGIYSLVRLKTNLYELISNIRTANRSSILVEDIDYVAIYMKLKDSLASVDNVTERIEELSNFLKNISLDGFQLSTRNISEQTFSRTGNISTELELDDIDLPSWLHRAVSSGYEVDGSAILPLELSVSTVGHTCLTTYAISADTFCPKLVYRTSELRLSVYNGHVYLNDMRIHISPSTLLFSENGDYVTLCLDTYTALYEYSFPDNQDTTWSLPLVILTAVCAAFSLLSLMVTLAVYIMLPSLRTIPGLNNMGLIISLIAFFVLSFINTNVDGTSMSNMLCKVFGITWHFSLLSSFSWMFVCTLHMARVFGNPTKLPVNEQNHSVFIYYIIFTQVVSFIIVIATVFVCYHISDGENIGYSNDPCYVKPSIQPYSVAIPIALVVILNFSMFAFVVITVSRLGDINKNTSHERHNLVIFVKLSTLTGLTWIFGFVYRMTNIEAFVYIFTVLNASQGVFIMISFAINKRVYKMLRLKWEQFTSASRMSRRKSTSENSDNTPRNISANTSRNTTVNSSNTSRNTSESSVNASSNTPDNSVNTPRNNPDNSVNTSRNTPDNSVNAPRNTSDNSVNTSRKTLNSRANASSNISANTPVCSSTNSGNSDNHCNTRL